MALEHTSYAAGSRLKTALALVFAWNECAIRRLFGHSWHAHPTSDIKRLVDGTISDGFLMRRRVAGQWQYRRANEEECEDMMWHQARGL